MNGKPAVVATGLTKTFLTGFLRRRIVRAVEGVSLNLQAGEVFGFLGPNGAGKTTCLQCLIGLLQPSTGEVSLLGGSPADPRVRERVGYMPEEFAFQPYLTGREFLGYHAGLYGLRGADERLRIAETLRLVGMEDSQDVRLARYSKGMLQRIGLAQALLNRPALLFLDEPTSGLDPEGRRAVREVILNLKQFGTTVFLNSHMLSEVERTCDQIGILSAGRLVRCGSLSDLLGAPDSYSVEYRAHKMDEIRTEHAPTQHALTELLQNLTSAKHRVVEVRQRGIALEDYYIEVLHET